MPKPKPASKTLKFASFDEFVEAAKGTARNNDSSRGTGREAFYGTASFEDAVTLASRGWPEGASRASEFRASLDSAVRDVTVARQAGFAFDVVGEAIDVGKFLSGEPECCLTRSESGESASGRIVRIVANVAASGSVSADSLFARGAVVLAAIDILEGLGHRVELTVARGTTTNGQTLQIFVPIKSAGQPLDLDRLAFALCHPSFLRRLTWSVSEQHDYIPKYTYPAPVDTEEDCVVTSEIRRRKDFTRAELLAEVADLCEKCGVSIPADEIAALVGA